MKKVGLYFGTFNPIHIGHMVIANHMVEFSDLDEVWFVVTPQSPFKVKKTLLDDNHRYQMVFEATKETPGCYGCYKGELQNMETYVYYAKAQSYTDEVISKEGYFTLVR